MEAVFVYVTCRDRAEAMAIGESVVAARLAACANVMDGMTSVYWWEGKLETGQEAVLIFKTRAELVPALTAEVKARHSYSVPCVVAMPIVGGNADYLGWIGSETEVR